MAEPPSSSPPPPELPPWPERRLWQIQPIRDVLGILTALIAIVGILWLGYALRSIFTPVLIALALAYLFQPLIRYSEQRTTLSRPAVIGLLMTGLGLVGLVVLVWLGPQFVSQLIELARAVPRYLASFAEAYDTDLGNLEEEVRTRAREIQDDPGGMIVSAIGTIFAGTSAVFGVVGQVIGTTVYVLMSLLLICVYFFFFAWHFESIVGFFGPFIPASKRDEALRLLRKMDDSVATFFRARFSIALIMGVMFSIGWAVVGVPYWFLLGMASGLLSLVPFASVVGWPVAVGLMWLHTLDTGAAGNGEGEAEAAAAFSFWMVIFWPSFVYLLVQGIEGWVLTPVIQGRSMNMSVVTVLLAVFVGGALGGFYGLLLAIPLTACGRIMLYESILPRLRAWATQH